LIFKEFRIEHIVNLVEIARCPVVSGQLFHGLHPFCMLLTSHLYPLPGVNFACTPSVCIFIYKKERAVSSPLGFILKHTLQLVPVASDEKMNKRKYTSLKLAFR
jgi:hypothetical protein